MHLFEQLRSHILRHVLPDVVGFTVSREAVPQSVLDAITVELPRDPSHGDVSTNAAMVLAKPLKKLPRDIAESMLEGLKQFPAVTDATIAGPGFINLRMKPAFWQNELIVLLDNPDTYGDSAMGEGQRINVEYVSANPTGPLHIGHSRMAVVGDALAALLTKAGYEVVKEYYVNDAGAQIDVLARSVYQRYRQAYGEEADIAEGMYPGEYLIAVGEALKDEYGGTLLDEAEEEWLPEVRLFAVEEMLKLIRQNLAELGIEHDIFTSELALRDDGLLDKGLAILEDKDLIYQGVLAPPKGKAPPEDWEATEQTLFRSSQFSDDSDRPVRKSNGDYTYFAGDIAYTHDKLSREFDTLIIMLGADHGGYVKRMEALTHALSDGEVSLKTQLCQLVKLLDGGKPVKMSKRAGNFVQVSDVVRDVGKDVLRFMMLTRKPEQMLDFDLQKVKEQSKDNPVFYVQYAHARCKSVLRLAHQSMKEAAEQSADTAQVNVSLLDSPSELALIKRLASFPRTVELATQSYEPHRIIYFLQELSSEFHSFWNKGGDEKKLRFIIEENGELTKARLALARAVATVIASGLAIAGVEPVDEMR